MREGGAETLVVEKQAVVGGSTGVSGGTLWIPDNPLMREDGVPDSSEEATAYLEATVGDAGPSTSLARKDAFLRTGPTVVEFLRAQGVRLVRSAGYSDYYDERPGGKAEGRVLEPELFDRRELGPLEDWVAPAQGPLVMYTREAAALSLMGRTRASAATLARVIERTVRARASGRHLVGAGRALLGRMLVVCVRTEVTIWRETPLLELVEENGIVVGVVVRRGSRDLRVRARRGVLLATGGFARDTAMREAHSPADVRTAWTAANPGDTGEAIRMAVELGAATDLLDQAWWTPVSVLPDGTPSFVVWERGKPHGIIVDSSGRRFCNEAASYQDVAQAMLDGGTLPTWFVMDSRHRQRYLWGVTPPRVNTKDWIATGYFKSGDSVEALAVEIGVDPAALRETVHRFNAFAVSGRDTDFHRGERAYDRYYGDPRVRPNPCLGALEQAPFYAVALYPGDTGTCGGLLTDVDARVLREDGQPIDGLYATGNATASVFGRSYPGSGASIAASLVWGYRAARHALGRET
jgi:3-oxosteroid 1-dehydrogenase